MNNDPGHQQLLADLIRARDLLASGGTIEDAQRILDEALAQTKCPNEGPVEPCPDCGEPWWTVQRRCRCFPKPGTLEAENEELQTAVRHYSGLPVKVALARLGRKQ